MSEADYKKLYYIQRFIKRPDTDPADRLVGLRKFFITDYMGSAEFETGSPARAIQALRGWMI